MKNQKNIKGKTTRATRTTRSSHGQRGQNPVTRSGAKSKTHIILFFYDGKCGVKAWLSFQSWICYALFSNHGSNHGFQSWNSGTWSSRRKIIFGMTKVIQSSPALGRSLYVILFCYRTLHTLRGLISLWLHEIIDFVRSWICRAVSWPATSRARGYRAGGPQGLWATGLVDYRAGGSRGW